MNSGDLIQRPGRRERGSRREEREGGKKEGMERQKEGERGGGTCILQACKCLKINLRKGVVELLQEELLEAKLLYSSIYHAKA